MSKASLLAGIKQFLVVLWVGAIWSSALLVAPTLFAHADMAVAGGLMAHLFERLTWLTMVLGSALVVLGLVFTPVWRRRAVIAAVLMVLLSMLIEFAIGPWMSSLRANPDTTRETFMQIHLLAVIVYAGVMLASLFLLSGRRTHSM